MVYAPSLSNEENKFYNIDTRTKVTPGLQLKTWLSLCETTKLKVENLAATTATFWLGTWPTKLRKT